MEKLKEIYLNDNFSYLDIIIMSYKEKYNSPEDIQELATRLNMSVALLREWTPGTAKPKKPMKKSNIDKYIALFFDYYLQHIGRKYQWGNKGQEIGCFVNIAKRINLEEWEKVLKFVFWKYKQYKKKAKLKFTWTRICETLKSPLILSELNFILREISDFERSKKALNTFRDDEGGK